MTCDKLAFAHLMHGSLLMEFKSDCLAADCQWQESTISNRCPDSSVVEQVDQYNGTCQAEDVELEAGACLAKESML